jgi:hypothetical protein
MTTIYDFDAAINAEGEEAFPDKPKWLWMVKFKTANGDVFFLPVTEDMIDDFFVDIAEMLSDNEEETANLKNDEYSLIRVYIGSMIHAGEIPVIPVIDADDNAAMLVMGHVVSYRVDAPSVLRPDPSPEDTGLGDDLPQRPV